ncbi:MAG: hypothetical protein HY748_14850 [Elusimicrobia bacterium]|nr:hypothetical protein [Elusimicrobiota bacterium]
MKRNATKRQAVLKRRIGPAAPAATQTAEEEERWTAVEERLSTKPGADHRSERQWKHFAK